MKNFTATKHSSLFPRRKIVLTSSTDRRRRRRRRRRLRRHQSHPPRLRVVGFHGRTLQITFFKEEGLVPGNGSPCLFA